MARKFSEERINSYLDLVRFHHQETELRRIPMELENALLEKVRNGDYANIKIASLDKYTVNMGRMSFNQRKQLEYIVVAAIALISRTAIAAGVEPDEAFDLSDTLLTLLDNAETAEDLRDIYELGAVMFAKRVHVLKTGRSHRVNLAVEYIHRNIYQKLTLNEVAQYIQVSPSYLSKIFARDMGIGILAFIQQEKISVAANLLAHTDQPISSIAVYLSFESASNFGVVFKKWIGMSPREYRNRYRKDVY